MPNTIYKITNIINNKVYIGQTIQKINRRWTAHKQDAKKLNYYLYRAMRKYGIENFSIEPIFTILNKEDLNEFEIQFIAEYNSYNNGYNMTIGGNSICGYHHTEETKKKISIQQKGKVLSKHTKKLLSQVNLGKKSANWKGYWYTPFGIFESLYHFSKTVDIVSQTALHFWCNHPNKIISKASVGQSKYLTPDMLGKTYREVGFYFVKKSE